MTDEERIMFAGFKHAMEKDASMNKEAGAKDQLFKLLAGAGKKIKGGAQKAKDMGTYFRSGFKGTNPGRPASKANFAARNIGSAVQRNKKGLAYGAGGTTVLGGGALALSGDGKDNRYK